MAVGSVTFTGGPELVAALGRLSDVRELTAANGVAARTVSASARKLAPSGRGSLSGTIGEQITPTGWQVGSNSPYARWFHVPYLSDGRVKYAKKVSSRGRSYGQRIPYNPFLNSSVAQTETQIVDAYVDGTAHLIDRAMVGVPRG